MAERRQETKAGTIGRRAFLQASALGLGVGLGWVRTVAAAAALGDDAQSPSAGGVVLFQGDSITDAGRDRERAQPNDARGLGFGYAGLAAAQLLAAEPAAGWQCYNRGISGHKVFQLADRWDADCLDLKPDVLSILIGVNDFWHTLTNGYTGTVAIYERDFRALLDRTQAALPTVRLIIGEPFAVARGTSITDAWFPAFREYQAAARRVSDAYAATWIPYQSLFDAALRDAPVSYWCPDGVHPAPPGSYLMAQAWLKALRSCPSQPSSIPGGGT